MSFSVQDVLKWTQGRLANSDDLGTRLDKIRVSRPSSLGISRSSDVAFFFSRAFEHELHTAQPGILITAEAIVPALQAAPLPLWTHSAVVACRDPYLAMALVSEQFAPQLSSESHLPGASLKAPSEDHSVKIHPTACISPSAVLAPGVRVGAHCVVEDESKIGANSVLYPGCYVGPRCSMGENSVLFPGVLLYEGTQIGNRVRIHAGSVLGADGFGYAPKRQAEQVVGHQKIYHLGQVIIGDDVEIGANSCVDRGTFGETRIEASAKLDNLVHVGHNSRVEEGAVICGGTCLAGNARVGRFAYIGGLTGIANHVHIGDGAKVGAISLVTKDVAPGRTAVGNPQREHQEHFRAHALLGRLLTERRKK